MVPDGRTIVFASDIGGVFNLYRRPADGSGNQELLYGDDRWKVAGSFSPDGKYLAYSATTAPTDVRDSGVRGIVRDGIWILPDPLGTRGAAKPYPFMPAGFAEGDPQFSPDGRWLAYDSNESGKFEVYVAPDSRLVAGETGDKEAFYIACDSRLMAAEVDTQGDAFEVKKVIPLFGLEGTARECSYCYDVSADGQRFLISAAPEGETGQQLTVVQNWTAEIDRAKQ